MRFCRTRRNDGLGSSLKPSRDGGASGAGQASVGTKRSRSHVRSSGSQDSRGVALALRSWSVRFGGRVGTAGCSGAMRPASRSDPRTAGPRHGSRALAEEEAAASFRSTSRRWSRWSLDLSRCLDEGESQPQPLRAHSCGAASPSQGPASSSVPRSFCHDLASPDFFK